MATLEDLTSSEAEFASAFNEDVPERAELSEDEAFGIMPLQPSEDGASDGNSADQGGAAKGGAMTLQPAAGDALQAEADAVAGAAEPGERIEGDVAMQDQPSEEDLQRQRSWEGRLRAREAQLAAKQAELEALAAQLQAGQQPVMRADGGEVEDALHEAGEGTEVEAMEDAAEQLESGKPVDAVIQSLRDDFGDDFVSAIESLVQAKAAEIAERMVGEKVGDVNGAVEALITNLQDRDERAHFSAIAKVHPDFMEVANGEGMGAYLAALPPNERAAAESVIDGGSAEDVIALIDAVKSHGKPQAAPQDDEAMAAAEGVRSNGLKIPEKPGKADDYEGAWAEF